MTGKLTSGTGWLPRTDGKYSNPMSMEQFHEFNRKYVQTKLDSATPSLEGDVGRIGGGEAQRPSGRPFTSACEQGSDTPGG